MIASPRFVFLHLHKSGGTYVNECLLRFVPQARQVGYHLPRSAIPPEFAALPVLGVVRNPWSYYVSWYAFQAARPQPNALFRVLSDDGRAGFAGTISNAVELTSDAGLLARVVAALPTNYTGRGLNLPGPELALIRGSGLGLYAYLYRHLFGADGPTHAARMERLREELPKMLEAVGEPVTDGLRQHLATAAPSNVSSHGPYAGYYQAELRERIAERDALVIQRYGYRFGD
jgi:hypothetical protein